MQPKRSPKIGRSPRPYPLPSQADHRTSSNAALAYRVNDFCEIFGIGRSSVYKLINDGSLPSVVIAGRRLIPRDAAEALLRGGE